jgi:DNA-binding CsgD family transcriptional regulator
MILSSQQILRGQTRACASVGVTEPLAQGASRRGAVRSGSAPAGALRRVRSPLRANAARLDLLDLVRDAEAAGHRLDRWRPVLVRVANLFGASWCGLVEQQEALRQLLAASGDVPRASAPRQSSIEVAGGLRLELAGARLDGESRKLLDALALQLGRTWRRAGEEERAVLAPAALAAALDRLAFGVLLAAPGGAVLFANAAARELLGEQRGLALRGGRLQAVDHHLQERLDGVLTGASTRPAEPERGLALRVPGPDGKALEVTVVPTATPWASRHEGGALVLLSHAASGHPAPAEVLRDLYGLTPAEARVAQALLAGQGVPEAAAALGCRPSTVRAHLKNLYTKLGTTRRADLVRLLVVGPGRVRW